jgi:maltooligosyltrehalose trehalohydrolase
MLFEGEEWAASSPFQYFADHQDRELARAVSEGRKREFAAFGWAPERIPDPENPATFQASKLNWSEVNQPQHAEMLEWYRALIGLRRKTPSLNDAGRGNVHIAFDEERKWLRMERGTIVLVCNLGAEDGSFRVPRGSVLELASREKIQIEGEQITLPRDSVAVVRAVE